MKQVNQDAVRELADNIDTSLIDGNITGDSSVVKTDKIELLAVKYDKPLVRIPDRVKMIFWMV